MPDQPKAYSYVRMSSELQLGGDSLRRQLERSAEFAAKHNLDLTDPIQDLGVSAFRGNNVEFGNLRSFLDLVEQGKVERGTYLIVESLDRLSRANVTKAFSLLLNIVSSGINVATLTDGQIYTAETLGDNGGQIFLALGSMLRAHDESRTKSQRIAAAWANKRVIARRGGVKSRLTRTAPLWLRVSEGRESVVAIEDRAALVREIFELARDGWGANSIAKRFNSRGEQPWGTRRKLDRNRGKAIWHESYVKKILVNRSVLGEFQPHHVEHSGGGKKGLRVPDGEVIANYFPRIVSDDLFLSAKAAMAARSTNGRGRKGAAYRNIFSGLLTCGLCGRTMKFLNKGSVKRGASQWLACSNQQLRGGCQSIPWRYLPFESAFMQYMKHVDVTHLLGGERRDDKISALQKEIRRLVELATVNSARLENLVNVLGAGGSPTIAAEIRRIELEQASNDAARTSSEIELSRLLGSALVSNRDELMRLLNRIAVRRDRKPQVDARRSFSAEIRRVVKRVELYSGESVDPWMAESEMEMEMLEKLSEHALRERRHYFRVEYLSGELDTIHPYLHLIPLHGSRTIDRDRNGQFRKPSQTAAKAPLSD
ncbi:MAG: recombinase family protein [Dokdonella sp.]